LCVAAANLTPAELAVKAADRTSVKNACHEAVVAGVLHVYNYAIDMSGVKVPLTKPKVAT
jgi:hypothetical protein